MSLPCSGVMHGEPTEWGFGLRLVDPNLQSVYEGELRFDGHGRGRPQVPGVVTNAPGGEPVDQVVPEHGFSGVSSMRRTIRRPRRLQAESDEPQPLIATRPLHRRRRRSRIDLHAQTLVEGATTTSLRSRRRWRRIYALYLHAFLFNYVGFRQSPENLFDSVGTTYLHHEHSKS
jgi:hypothetical protein